MVHFNRLDFSRNIDRSEGNSHTRLKNTSFNTTNRDSTNTTNLVDILKRKTEWLINRSLRRMNSIKSFNQNRSLVPRHVSRTFKHVITIETRNRNERNTFLNLSITNLSKETSHFSLNFIVTSFRIVDTLIIHLIDTANHLLDTKSVSKKSMFTSLTILTITSFEFTSTSSNNQNSNISLRSTSNHILNEITVTRSINNSEEILFSLELPKRNINGNTTFTFSLHLI